MATKKKATKKASITVEAVKDKILSRVIAYLEEDESDGDADSYDLGADLKSLRNEYSAVFKVIMKDQPTRTVQVELTESQLSALRSRFDNDDLCLGESLVKKLKEALK